MGNTGSSAGSRKGHTQPRKPELTSALAPVVSPQSAPRGDSNRRGERDAGSKGAASHAINKWRAPAATIIAADVSSSSQSHSQQRAAREQLPLSSSASIPRNPLQDSHDTPSDSVFESQRHTSTTVRGMPRSADRPPLHNSSSPDRREEGAGGNPLSGEGRFSPRDDRAAELSNSANSANSASELSFGVCSRRALLPEPDLQVSTRGAEFKGEVTQLVSLRRRILPSWRRAEELGNMITLGTEVYHHMLAMNPNLAPLFGGLFLADQGRALMEMLTGAIDPPDIVTPQDSLDLLVSAGARHRGYGVSDDTFPALREAFLDVFPHFTDAALYEEAMMAWIAFFDLVIVLLSRGAYSAEGMRLGAMYHKQMTRVLAKDWHLIEDRQERDTNHKFIIFMCQKGCLLKPALSVHTALFDLRVGKRIFDTITSIVDHLDEVETVEEYLSNMGVNHNAWNITYSDFLVFTNPFLETCEYYLSDIWTVAMETRFARLFQFLIDGMARGMGGTQSGSTSVRVPA